MLLYNLLLFLFSPLIYAYLLYRLSKGKEDRDHWGERWGRLPEEAVRSEGASPRFWVHAVSVGEVMAAASVLRELRRRFPDALIVLSTTTIGGREVAQKQIPPADAVVYYPLDFAFAVRRALDSVRPDAVLLMEWEIWPNFLTSAKRRGAKIAVLNGRIADRGLKRAKGPLAALITAPALAAVDLFAMQSEEDSRRAALVGADPARVRTFGNTKFDESVTPLPPEERAALRADLEIPPDVPVWVCGSTRDPIKGSAEPDEETLVAEAFRLARERVPDLKMILAPRHLERANLAAGILEAAGFTVGRRSRREPPGDVLLLDTFGELGRVYAVGDVAFVGGSLIRQGGQSVFQPLAQGVPALFGPYMNNQRDIAALAKAEGVGFQVDTPEALAAEVVRLVNLTADEKSEIAHRARRLIERNQGVSIRCVDAVARLLDGAP